MVRLTTFCLFKNFYDEDSHTLFTRSETFAKCFKTNLLLAKFGFFLIQILINFHSLVSKFQKKNHSTKTFFLRYSICTIDQD